MERKKLPFETGANNTSNEVRIKVHFDAHSTDPQVTEKIEKNISENLPFALQCKTSVYVFIPENLMIYFINGECKNSFKVQNQIRLAELAAMILLSHKEFMDWFRVLNASFLLRMITRFHPETHVGTVSLLHTNDSIQSAKDR